MTQVLNILSGTFHKTSYPPPMRYCVHITRRRPTRDYRCDSLVVPLPTRGPTAAIAQAIHRCDPLTVRQRSTRHRLGVIPGTPRGQLEIHLPSKVHLLCAFDRSYNNLPLLSTHDFHDNEEE